jgi:glycerol-3-phosphate dehydrogenase (NAD(P)+)
MGQELARGKSLDQVKEAMGGQIAEGVTTTVVARELAGRHAIEMPITEQLHSVLFEGRAPLEGVQALLTREPTDEFLSLGVTSDE